MSDHELLDNIIDGLMRRYQARVTDVQKIIRLMHDQDLIQTVDDIDNDHIAFRTIGVPQLGIASLEKIFLNCGYQRRESLYISGKEAASFLVCTAEPQVSADLYQPTAGRRIVSRISRNYSVLHRRGFDGPRQ